MENASKEREEQCRAVTYVIRLQIAKQMDSVRAREAWSRMLENIPREVIAEALSQQLSSRRYQEVPDCRCCCRH